MAKAIGRWCLTIAAREISEAEANLKENKLSVSSPIGKVLLGTSVGAKVKAQTPGGEMEFVVLNITA